MNSAKKNFHSTLPERVFFTLIELLVTIAIIAILASLLLPALKNVRAKGKEIACAGNLKQISCAFSLYCQDYDGWFPYSTGMPSGDYWFKDICDYAGGLGESIQYQNRVSCFKCPSTNGMSSAGWSYSTDYTMNYNIADGWSSPHNRKISSITNPSQLNLATDGLGGIYNYGHWDDLSLGVMRIQNRHNNGANFLFCDGHGRWYKFADWKNINMTP
jgi:prepilin-type processing-associated H-X9-DG protein/prepilin-type N-terminal cleavage/methylation domain-containing protein